MLLNKKKAQHFTIEGGVKGVLYPPSQDGAFSIAEVMMDGVYPLKGYSVNQKCTETMTIIDGQFIIEVDKEQTILKQGDTFSVLSGQKYRMWGKGKSIDFITPAWESNQNKILQDVPDCLPASTKLNNEYSLLTTYSSPIKLLYGSTKDANIKYALGFNVADAVFCLEINGEKLVYLDKRELEIVKAQKKLNIKTIALEPIIEKAKQINDEIDLNYKVGYVILQENNLLDTEIQIASDMPFGLVDYLKLKGVTGLKESCEIMPDRIQKKEVEISIMKDIMKRLCQSFDRIEEMLKQSQIQGDRIIFQHQALTSEILKQEVNLVLMQNGLIDTEGMIISCGQQSAIPHHQGEGLIRPHQTVVCDIFPMDIKTGYYGDMTRTYVKGVPNNKIVQIHKTVEEVHSFIVQQIKTGITGKSLYELTCSKFKEQGFDVGEKGFIHGLGHGLGLDIHEKPFLNAHTDDVLQVGNVFSIEPGLYYPELGGVRIEDIIAITENGVENLTDYRKIFVIE